MADFSRDLPQHSTSRVVVGGLGPGGNGLHQQWGETPHGFVVLKSGASVTEAELYQLARDHLAHFKAPRGISFVSELPKTATGKIQKYVLCGGRTAISAT